MKPLDYNFTFPANLIANKPANPRESARLLAYNRKTQQTTLDTFKNIGKFLPKNCVLVLNQTKVIPARLEVTKPTGGKARLLFLSQEKHLISALSDRKLELGSTLTFGKTHKLVVMDKKTNQYILKTSSSAGAFQKLLATYGTTPLPPYIKNSPLTEKQARKEYQTVFAKTPGSVAAPTASLHFTKQLLNKLKKQGVKIEYVTLHVGLGTFATLTEKNIKQKKLHSEFFYIDTKTAQRLNRYKALGYPIIPVGTTAVRTLESAANKRGKITKLTGNTTLFIQEGDKHNFVDGLITNFHVPQSSLLMLVSSFVGRKKLLELYALAIKKKFRLFSFGDGMLIT